MGRKKQEAIIQWRESIRYFLLRKKIEFKEKTFFQNFKPDIIIFFSFFFIAFIIRFSYIFKRFTVFNIIYSFFIVCIASIILTILNRLFADISGMQIKVFEDHISLRPWIPSYIPYSSISEIIFFKGIYKKMDYNLIKIYGSKRLLRFIFLHKKISLDNLVKFFKDKKIKVKYKNV